jgi:hypothetical protein
MWTRGRHRTTAAHKISMPPCSTQELAPRGDAPLPTAAEPGERPWRRLTRRRWEKRAQQKGTASIPAAWDSGGGEKPHWTFFLNLNQAGLGRRRGTTFRRHGAQAAWELGFERRQGQIDFFAPLRYRSFITVGHGSLEYMVQQREIQKTINLKLVVPRTGVNQRRGGGGHPGAPLQFSSNYGL